MWLLMVYLVPILLPTLVVNTTACGNITNDDVIVSYSGHAEAEYNVPDETTRNVPVTFSTASPTPTPTLNLLKLTTPVYTSKTTIIEEQETENIIFIPNDAPVIKRENEENNLHDILVRKDINDVMDRHYKQETEAPSDIVFIADKNKDTDTEDKKKEGKKDGRRKEKKMKARLESLASDVMDCDNLDCSNTIQAICGTKSLNGKLHYRLFLNDCYFRKVNCNFKYDLSRYIKSPMSKCAKVGAHFDEKPFYFVPKPVKTPKEENKTHIRRSFSSRRSMATNINGQFCSHPCPVSCPDDYEPECGISATGQRRVFMNHCKLDDNSCLYAVVWHRRPLSECVGGKKADMRQNRFFIGWMQKVGILDRKGKLVLE